MHPLLVCHSCPIPSIEPNPQVAKPTAPAMETRPGEAICSAQCAVRSAPQSAVHRYYFTSLQSPGPSPHSPNPSTAQSGLLPVNSGISTSQGLVAVHASSRRWYTRALAHMHALLSPQVPQPSVRPVLQPTSVALWPRICHLPPTMTPTTGHDGHNGQGCAQGRCPQCTPVPTHDAQSGAIWTHAGHLVHIQHASILFLSGAVLVRRLLSHRNSRQPS